MEAHVSYKSGFVDQSAIKYYFLAELGYEVAQSNVAYLLDKGKVFDENGKIFDSKFFIFFKEK